MGGGRVFALYVAAYTAGRAYIESLRIDNAHRFFGLRLNDYVSIIVFLLAVAYLIRRRGRGDVPYEPANDQAGEPGPVDLIKHGESTSAESATAESATAESASADSPTVEGTKATADASTGPPTDPGLRAQPDR
jgi:hypothetical protein